MREKRTEMIRFLMVFSSAVLAGVLFSWWMVSSFGPTGNYQLSVVLVNPEMAEELDYSDVDPGTSKKKAYAYQRVEYLYFDGNWNRKEITLDQYDEFYELIKGDKSVTPTDQIIGYFANINPSIISIVVKEKETATTKVFQEVQVSTEGSYYRVQLRQQGSSMNWAYFEHPGIYKKVTELLK